MSSYVFQWSNEHYINCSTVNMLGVKHCVGWAVWPLRWNIGSAAVNITPPFRRPPAQLRLHQHGPPLVISNRLPAEPGSFSRLPAPAPLPCPAPTRPFTSLFTQVGWGPSPYPPPQTPNQEQSKQPTVHLS